jgi:tetratricopeptide (TPR) repeat protein
MSCVNRILAAILAGLFSTNLPAQGTLPPGFTDAAGQLFLRGKVTMEDGTVPPPRIPIYRLCRSLPATFETVTNKKGEFLWRSVATATTIGRADARSSGSFQCWLVARKDGLESNRIDLQDPAIYRRLDLPPLVLHAVTGNSAMEEHTLSSSAAKVWARALKAVGSRQWPEAERLARQVTSLDPKFAPAWSAVGTACWNQKRNDAARSAFQQAVAADPSSLLARAQLLRAEMQLRLWADASATAAALMKADTEHRHVEAYVNHGIARYMLHDLNGAAASLGDAIRLDAKHQAPQSEYLLGVVQAAKGDREAAATHFRTYLQYAPSASNAELAKKQLEALSRPEPIAAAPPPEEILKQAPEPEIVTRGEAWVPGGRRALAAIARLRDVPSPEEFFLEYCRAIAAQNSRLTESAIAGFMPALRAYVTTIPELAALGEQRDGRTVITLSLSPGADAQKTARILKLLGWRVGRDGDAVTIEPGYEAADAARQQILRALGVDDLAMRQQLVSGKSFPFEIVSEDATLFGGAGWGRLLTRFPSLPGGMAEAFVAQPRLARTYAGLGALGSELALALIGRVGLYKIDTEYSGALWLYGDAFRISAGTVAVPGGGGAEGVWTELAGASPRDPAKFLDAVLKADGGRLAAFYAALAHADRAHGEFFTATEARARRFYEWYRDSEELRDGIGARAPGWHRQVLQKLPLDSSGRVRFPGGRAAWSSSQASTDDDVLLPGRGPSGPKVDFEALLAAARLEEERGAELDAESARLFARNFGEWSSLAPHFAALRGLGAAGFRALDGFTRTMAARSPAGRNPVLGEWHSLTMLIVLGVKSGALDDAAAARGFTEACTGLAGSDHSSRAIGILRTLIPGARSLDDAIAGQLLRLTGSRLTAFDRVRQLQDAPRLDATGPSPAGNRTALALAGAVYGAILDPDSLLVSEDRC